MRNRDYRLKEPPEYPIVYLGVDICQYHIGGDLAETKFWSMSTGSHMKKAIEKVQKTLRRMMKCFNLLIRRLSIHCQINHTDQNWIPLKSVMITR